MKFRCPKPLVLLGVAFGLTCMAIGIASEMSYRSQRQLLEAERDAVGRRRDAVFRRATMSIPEGPGDTSQGYAVQTFELLAEHTRLNAEWGRLTTAKDALRSNLTFWILAAQIPSFVSAPFAIWRQRQDARRRKRRLAGLCGACGYDVRESPDRCPECGEAVTGPPPVESTVSGAGRRSED